VGRGIIKLFFSVIRSSNDEASNDFCVAVYDILSQGEFNASENVVSGFEVVELNSTNTLCNRSIPPVLVRDQVFEFSNDRWVVRVRIIWVSWIVNHGSTRISSWNQVVEDSEAIASV